MNNRLSVFDDTTKKEKILDIILKFPENRKDLQGELKKFLEGPHDVNDPNYKTNQKIGHEIGLKILRTLENDSHCAMMESFNENNRIPVFEMTNDLIKELNCTTEIEKSLASTVVMSYMRFLDNSRRLNNEYETGQISDLRNKYIDNLSKQIDRAYRQYITSLVTLQQIKAPKLELTVKTKNAFIGQNNIQPNI
jgi:hypothetical protein